MKRTIYRLLPLVLLSACASSPYRYKADYDYAIKATKVNHNLMTMPEAASLNYKDDWMDVSFLPGAEGVYMNLNNVSNENLHVVWDQSVIIHKSRALKVFHNGIKFNEASGFMPNSVIPPETLLEDHISPSAFTVYHSPTEYSSGGWSQRRIMKQQFTRAPERDYEEFKRIVESLKNSDLYGLMLTLEKGNEIRTYQFDFQIASASVSEL